MSFVTAVKSSKSASFFTKLK